MLIKKYGVNPESEKRYSPSTCTGCKKEWVMGNPDPAHVSTSFAERANLTMRMSMRRFARLTNAFNKKPETHAAAVSLHFMYYNFARIHQKLRSTLPREDSVPPESSALDRDDNVCMTTPSATVRISRAQLSAGEFGGTVRRLPRHR